MSKLIQNTRLQNGPFLRQKSENRGFWASFGTRSWSGRTGRGRSRVFDFYHLKRLISQNKPIQSSVMITASSWLRPVTLGSVFGCSTIVQLCHLFKKRHLNYIYLFTHLSCMEVVITFRFTHFKFKTKQNGKKWQLIKFGNDYRSEKGYATPKHKDYFKRFLSSKIAGNFWLEFNHNCYAVWKILIKLHHFSYNLMGNLFTCNLLI